MKTITAQDIHKIRTPAGGFNRETIEVLGLSWPLNSGWRYHIIGKEVPDQAWLRAQEYAKRGPTHFFNGQTRRV